MRIEDILDLVNKEKRISERAAAVAQKVGATVLITAGVVVGVAGIVLVVKVKRKIWSNFHKVVSPLKKRACTEKEKNYEKDINNISNPDKHNTHIFCLRRKHPFSNTL